MNLKLVFFIVSIMLMVLAAGMCIPAVWDGLEHNPDWITFAGSALLTSFIAILTYLSTRSCPKQLHTKEAFIMVTLVWVILALFASLPLMMSEIHMSFTDAYFESISGLTTTGSTVITGLDGLPPGLHLWRGILQWLGGLGIIVMAVSVLPLLSVGGMQLFRVEAFDTAGKDLPRAATISGAITLTYIILTFICALALRASGMNWLESVVHAMTTIATGGYSTSDGSVGHFNSPVIETIIMCGMLVGGIPFLLFVKVIRGAPRFLFLDSQVRVYLMILAISIVLLTVWLVMSQGFPLGQALRNAGFSVISIMTGTGYTTKDYTTWGSFPIGFLFFLTFVGGCAGSTACGIKVFRLQILYKATQSMLGKLVHPHGVFIPRYNGSPINDNVLSSVLNFFFLFMLLFGILSLGLVSVGCDFVTAISSAATAISNVGPGLGPMVGPSGTFHDMPEAAKWLLSVGMLVGRLEIFSVVILFSPLFWRQ